MSQAINTTVSSPSFTSSSRLSHPLSVIDRATKIKQLHRTLKLSFLFHPDDDTSGLLVKKSYESRPYDSYVFTPLPSSSNSNFISNPSFSSNKFEVLTLSELIKHLKKWCDRHSDLTIKIDKSEEAFAEAYTEADVNKGKEKEKHEQACKQYELALHQNGQLWVQQDFALKQIRLIQEAFSKHYN